MHIYFPNSGHLQNFGGLVEKFDTTDPSRLEFDMHPRWVSVHPTALAMAACAGALVRDNGGTVAAHLSEAGGTLRYLQRMGLFEFLDVESGVQVIEHEPAGRFIPLSQISDSAALNQFIVNMVPLLHATPDEAGPIKYLITELVGNVLEHAASPVGAIVCAQYFGETSRLSLGVADAGVGIYDSITRFHAAADSLAAIQLALQPGVSGASARFGGNEFNAGAGLFFTKAIAHVSRNFFVIYSGDAMFKLLRRKEGEQAQLIADPSADRATRTTGLPPWPGTVIGIDINVGTHVEFQQLLVDIRRAYGVDVRQKKSDRRKAKFR